jgi:8-oxo-dGTP pyrophosphatase MutT (NUDIX family)
MKQMIRKKLRESVEPVSVSVGCLIKCTSTNRFFLLHRNDYKPSWSLMSGGVDEGETILEALKREIIEELSINPNLIRYEFIHKEIPPFSTNKEFNYYKGYVSNEFDAKLDHENLDCGWFDIDNLPEPLYPRLLRKIKEF